MDVHPLIDELREAIATYTINKCIQYWERNLSLDSDNQNTRKSVAKLNELINKINSELAKK